MNFYFDPKKLKLGMRTFKTGLAVFFVLLLFHIFGFQGLQIGALTAVFSLREDLIRRYLLVAQESSEIALVASFP
ncbi:hypothetical protein AKL14_01464 [Streptococcus parauberis]|nr:hypothetical protein AKL14_01464 [Streptococcus parauberis]